MQQLRTARRIAFELGYAGTFYHSRYGRSIKNLAIFEDWTMLERLPIHQPNSRKVAEDNPDRHEALRILGLLIGDRGSTPNPRARCHAAEAWLGYSLAKSTPQQVSTSFNTSAPKADQTIY
jgi:hypothetical protein